MAAKQITDIKDSLLQDGINENDREYLSSVIVKMQGSRQARRAAMLLDLADGMDLKDVAVKYKSSKTLIYRILHKLSSGGVKAAILDKERSGRPGLFSEEEKSYVRQIACQVPYNVEGGPDLTLWTASDLAMYIRNNCRKVGFGHLVHISARDVENLLNRTELKLHMQHNTYESKMQAGVVPILYKKLEFLVTVKEDLVKKQCFVVMGYDDSSHLSMVQSNYGYNHSGSEYRPYISNRILSFMAGVNLLNGHITLLKRFSHTMDDVKDFIELIASTYAQSSIKLILDRHKFHTSKECSDFIKAKALKVTLEFNPADSFYINLFDTFFSKMIRVRLNSLHSASFDDLETKIDAVVQEINECRVIKRWDDDSASKKRLCAL
ncbi:transposase [Anaerobiospirillum thomasii]|uniref:Transposase and inactivated derivatives n=1 Tax=Anaerobiospirillum thomasii TaxID=179995 RepID=A0A2X0V5F6_9GAMM|nr:transposase [Anaerobiospirillum thomasii]SPT69739.1 Transposase and inactivated derivatives [Anaerobiospirillum thomasii]